MAPPSLSGGPDTGRPRARARDADRDSLLALLREHYALGNLDDAELDRRTGLVLGAAYTDEAAAALNGLPLLSGQDQLPRPPRSRRRHGQADRPGPGWVPTSERFRDPASRQIVRVWVDPADDSRHYVPEPPGQ
ncbi:MAG TPA: DUF1707 domain-containing protein [Streptosporangiaceae bacterium]|nr:DUF1707 domain-containing protein [Streptosporangiaceae bacterium]